MDRDDKTIDITHREYEVKAGKRKEPFFNKGYILPALLTLLGIILAKIAFLWAMGRLPL